VSPHFCFQSSTQLSLASHSSYYQHPRSAYLALLLVTYLITLYNSHSPLSWEITPRRSISTRSLTGCSKVRRSSYYVGTYSMDTGAVDSAYPPYIWWYSVHVGLASRGRCPR
jgi:hypothetical protein